MTGTGLIFRSRPLDNDKPLPVYFKEPADMIENSNISRSLPQAPLGMEKEEETEHDLVRALNAQKENQQASAAIIPTPEVSVYEIAYNSRKVVIPPELIKEEFDAPISFNDNYDVDDQDEQFVRKFMISTNKKGSLDVEKFEVMMEALELCYQRTKDVDTVFELVKSGSVLSEVYKYWRLKRSKLNCDHAIIPIVKTIEKKLSDDPFVAFRKRVEKMQTRKNRKLDEDRYFRALGLANSFDTSLSLTRLVLYRESLKLKAELEQLKYFQTILSSTKFVGQNVDDYLSGYIPSKSHYSQFTTNSGRKVFMNNQIRHNFWNNLRYCSRKRNKKLDIYAINDDDGVVTASKVSKQEKDASMKLNVIFAAQQSNLTNTQEHSIDDKFIKNVFKKDSRVLKDATNKSDIHETLSSNLLLRKGDSNISLSDKNSDCLNNVLNSASKIAKTVLEKNFQERLSDQTILNTTNKSETNFVVENSEEAIIHARSAVEKYSNNNMDQDNKKDIRKRLGGSDFSFKSLYQKVILGKNFDDYRHIGTVTPQTELKSKSNIRFNTKSLFPVCSVAQLKEKNKEDEINNMTKLNSVDVKRDECSLKTIITQTSVDKTNNMKLIVPLPSRSSQRVSECAVNVPTLGDQNENNNEACLKMPFDSKKTENKNKVIEFFKKNGRVSDNTFNRVSIEKNTPAGVTKNMDNISEITDSKFISTPNKTEFFCKPSDLSKMVVTDRLNLRQSLHPVLNDKSTVLRESFMDKSDSKINTSFEIDKTYKKRAHSKMFSTYKKCAPTQERPQVQQIDQISDTKIDSNRIELVQEEQKDTHSFNFVMDSEENTSFESVMNRSESTFDEHNLSSILELSFFNEKEDDTAQKDGGLINKSEFDFSLTQHLKNENIVAQMMNENEFLDFGAVPMLYIPLKQNHQMEFKDKDDYIRKLNVVSSLLTRNGKGEYMRSLALSRTKNTNSTSHAHNKLNPLNIFDVVSQPDDISFSDKTQTSPIKRRKPFNSDNFKRTNLE